MVTAEFVPWVALALAWFAQPQSPLASTRITTGAGAEVIVHVAVADPAPPDAASLTAVILDIDGRPSQHVLLQPGTRLSDYVALIGPLTAGSHDIRIFGSPWWPSTAGLQVTGVSAEIAPDSDVLAHAPTFLLRADTIGTATDILLREYVEDLRRSGSGLLRYSVIFSNEDGGTATPALMARWGRTTDIEMAYEEVWRDGRVESARFQAPDHQVLPYRGPREGAHPALVVATLNNVFLDRGTSVVSVRPVPSPANLTAATRESVMDGAPWIYRVMSRELRAESKIGPSGIEEPRDFLYVEADLRLENGAVAALAGNADGAWRSSSRGEPALMVERNGWVRIAIPAGGNSVASVGWLCAPVKSGIPATCRIHQTRAFRLDGDYRPGPNLVRDLDVEMRGGEMKTMPVREGVRQR